MCTSMATSAAPDSRLRGTRRSLICAALAALRPGAAAGPELRQRRFAVTWNVQVPAGAGQRVSLWLPVPQDDASQRIEHLVLSSPGGTRVAEGEHGNRYGYCELTAAAPRLTMSFEVTRREHVLRPTGQPADLPGAAESRCCLGSDRLVPVDDRIRAWAREVVGPGDRSDVEKARAIYNHVIATVKYDKTGTGWGRGDIYYACDARRGNCTDFHAIFIGYCRAVGVPARFAIGLPLPAARGAGEIAGYHCWAEFYARGFGWVPVDASEAAKDPARRDYFFGAHDENRVELSRGRDLLLVPRQRGQPLNFFVLPYAEVEGEPLSGVTTQIRYRDRAG